MSPQSTFTTLISADELALLLKTGADVWVCDCSFDLAAPAQAEQAYDQEHLPGALYLHLERDLSGIKTGTNGRHPLPDPQAFVARLRQLGLNRAAQVIAYDTQQGMFAARLWWLLRWLGHNAVAVLDGGLQAWRETGLPTGLDIPPVRPAGDFAMGRSLARHVDVREVSEALVQLPSGSRCLIDARAADRYRGENETLDPRVGHIPGALNRFFKLNQQPDGRFKPPGQLRREYQALLGDTPVEQAILQCGSGVTACHNLLAMEVAGLSGAALYAGSWSEWSADPQRPICTGAAP